jgi:flagellar assembly factor FliW
VYNALAGFSAGDAMKVNTSRFGPIDISDSAVITIPHGLIGLPVSRRFAVLDGPDGTPFKWLQSVDEEWLAVVIIDPLIVKADYAVDLSRDDLADLKMDDLGQGIVAVICSIPGDLKTMTVNLMGPLVINVGKRVAKQVIQINPAYGTKHPMFPQGADAGQTPASGAAGAPGKGV